MLKKYFYQSNFCIYDNHGNHQPNNGIIFRFAAELFDDDHKNDQSHNGTALKIFWNIWMGYFIECFWSVRNLESTWTVLLKLNISTRKSSKYPKHRCKVQWTSFIMVKKIKILSIPQMLLYNLGWLQISKNGSEFARNGKWACEKCGRIDQQLEGTNRRIQGCGLWLSGKKPTRSMQSREKWWYHTTGDKWSIPSISMIYIFKIYSYPPLPNSFTIKSFQANIVTMICVLLMTMLFTRALFVRMQK